MKVVINQCYGGFSLSKAAIEEYAKRSGKLESEFYDRYIDRDDKDLVAIVEEMGEAANGSCADLNVVEIPDGISWQIEEYDGYEHVAEKHRTWS